MYIELFLRVIVGDGGMEDGETKQDFFLFFSFSAEEESGRCSSEMSVAAVWQRVLVAGRSAAVSALVATQRSVHEWGSREFSTSRLGRGSS